ncbi:hypothetical protein AB0E69_05895 [Kribbella sp. NPDC026611]|uniref:hypothetical protein n=1 Tax=Kribbella sp. NPDC026611 TaxID=3154911 RepID=UPI003400A21C
MSRESRPGWTAEATAPPREVTEKERRSIWWSALLDRARYRGVPLGEHTGWTRTQQRIYAEYALTLRQGIEAREDALEKEQATLQVLVEEPSAAPPVVISRPDGTARQLHDWAIYRRAELAALDASRTRTAARQAALTRLAEIKTELSQLEGEYETLRQLCETAYLVRAEMYCRIRCARADRNVADVPSAPPFDGPVWRTRRPHLTTVQTRSA